MTLEEQFGRKGKPATSLPKINIKNEKKPQIQLANDQKNRYAIGIAFKEHEKIPFNLSSFKIKFQKTSSGMIAFLPIFEEPIEIFVDWEQPVQPISHFLHSDWSYLLQTWIGSTSLSPLEKSLLSFTSCPDCDNDTKLSEVKAIQDILTEKRENNPIQGCIASSLDLIISLSSIPNSQFSTGTVAGASWFDTTTTRTWVKVKTKCFVFDLVATWYGPIRHQAVQVQSLWPGANDSKIVLDTWILMPRASQSLADWAGDKSELEDTGLVSSGF